MTAERMADTRRCPFCEQWIPMPARFAHKAFNAHKAHCSMAMGYGSEPAAPAPSPMRRWCPEHDRYCPFQGAEHIEETGQTLPSTFSVKRATTERPYPANASERHALVMANAYIETITRPTQGALL